MGNILRPWSDASRRVVGLLAHALAPLPKWIGAARRLQATVRVRLASRSGAALLVVGGAFLVIAIVLMEVPLAPTHMALIASVGLTGAALVTALISRPPPPFGATREIDRFQALSDRLEKGIEKL
ncbi:MAG: hypothetical protein AB7E81_14870, partial [Hyphomicrobiaceae bacterium]